jgi:glyoxylase-like metal-dependent hydrolase (beta-lactamase superfamily II)
MKYTIVPLNLGETELDEKSKFTYFSNFGEKSKFTFIAWLIDGGEKKILVDTGSGDVGWLKRHSHITLRPGPKGDLVANLLSLGIEPGGIDLVINTHLHSDHCFNNRLFNNAKFIIQHRELIHAINPVPTQRAIYAWAENEVPPFLWVSDKYKILKGDMEILPGIDVICTPGHTPGLQGVLVKTPSANVFLASDTIPLFENWETQTPSGIHVNLEDYYDTFNKIKSLSGAFILPGHDPKVFKQERYP